MYSSLSVGRRPIMPVSLKLLDWVSTAAIVEAATTRLRPILMTTAATVIGHFPLVLAKGPGAGARNSIGIMLVSGMIIGTVFTLFVVPSIYMFIAKTHKHTPEIEEELQQELGEPVDAVA